MTPTILCWWCTCPEWSRGVERTIITSRRASDRCRQETERQQEAVVLGGGGGGGGDGGGGGGGGDGGVGEGDDDGGGCVVLFNIWSVCSRVCQTYPPIYRN